MIGEFSLVHVTFSIGHLCYKCLRRHINNIMIQSNHLSLLIKEGVSITMQEAMLIELRVTTNNPPATGQQASQPL